MTPDEELLTHYIKWHEDGCSFEAVPGYPQLTDLWFARDAWSPELRKWFNDREDFIRARLGLEPREQ